MRLVEVQIRVMQPPRMATRDSGIISFLTATLVAAASRNSRLLWYYETLMNEAQRLFYMDISQHNREFQWGHGHEGIIQALRNRDEEAGVAAIRDTLERARKRVLGV